jgi:predicted alpha-1,6-mannanase (GH76 family)
MSYVTRLSPALIGVLAASACKPQPHTRADSGVLADGGAAPAAGDLSPPLAPLDLAMPADLTLPGDLTPPTAPPDLLPDPAIEEMHRRADSALSTLMLNFWPAIAANTTTFDWMYAHYWDALLDAAERRGKNAYSGTVSMFYELQAQRGWLDDYYDDENWIALALLHSYSVTGESIYLDQAKTVFADIMKGWDETCCGAHPGGIFWHKPNINKVTAINAGAVITGARLYQYTNDTTYLDFAKKTYAYWSTYMVDANTGHVYDGISTAGDINTTWSFT